MVQALPSSNCSSRSCTPPTTGGHPLLNGFKHPRRLSTNTLDQYSPLSEDHRKLSLSSAIQKTKEGLGNMFADDEQSPEELIYNLFKVPNKSDAFIGKLIMVLKNHGLQENDPRLAPMMRRIREIESEKEEKSNEARDPKHWKLSKNDFKRVISESMSLIVQTMQGDLIVPAWGQFTNIIRDIFEECALISDGKVADYIPQLARMLPDQWGVTICTVDGQRHAFGDSNIPFCVQSVSKAFNYSIAASELGAEYVHQYVGQEPSGRLFNEICLDSNNKPHNPMVNSGAIIVTSLVQNKLNIADRFEHMLNQYRKIAGGEYVGFNNAMFLSEANTADRNFALAYFMKENGCFPPETTSLREALDFYFQLCSLEVTCEGMAVMAATLANGGVCPLTGERCIGSRPCRDVLSLMNSCGMYDYSGQFAFHVGLPAKSGVSGVMIVVVPNLMGIALWSPPLDKLGNSVRGVEFCKRLVQRFNFHNYDSLVHNESPKFDPRHRLGERERAAVVSLLFAAKAGDLNTIRRMYMQSVDLEMADYDKRTALHLAASEGHFDVALFLLETGRVKADPRDRWNRTPLDDAREARHTSVALLLERRVQELEQAKSIPAGRPLSLAAKCSSLQLLPSQKPIAESPSTGSLNQALEIETADAQNDLSSERSTGLHEKRKLALSPLTHSFSAANSPQNVGDGHRPLMDSGLCTSVESNISPLPQNEASQNQRPNLLPLPFRDELESSGTMPYREPNHHHQLQQQQQHAEENQQHGTEHSPDEEQRIPNGSSHSAISNGRGGHNHNNNWGEATVEHNGSNATSAGVTDRPPFFCSDPSRNEMAQNKPHFELGDGQYYSSVDYSPSECRERLYSNGMRFWEEEKERMEEQATGATTLSLSRRRPEMGQQLSRTTGHSGSTSESEEEEEEDILANRDVRHRTAAPTKMSARSRGQQPDYHGHHRLANQRIEQLKQHHMI